MRYALLCYAFVQNGNTIILSKHKKVLITRKNKYYNMIMCDMNSYSIFYMDFSYICHTDNKLSGHDVELKKEFYLIPVFVFSVIFESSCQYFKDFENRFV